MIYIHFFLFFAHIILLVVICMHNNSADHTKQQPGVAKNVLT